MKMNNINWHTDLVASTERRLAFQRELLSKQMKVVLELEAQLAIESQRLRDAQTEESLKSLISLNHIA